MIAQTAALLFGLTVWYFMFGVECFLNGTTDGGHLMPLRCLVQDLSFNLPGGWERRMKATRGDAEWARQFPGWWHIWTVHFCVPFGPFILIRAIL